MLNEEPFKRSQLSRTILFVIVVIASPVSCFLLPTITSRHVPSVDDSTYSWANHRSRHPTALNVWWFGGTENKDLEDEDSCELVAVMIERTSANSRQISGEITVPTPLSDVWAILTDYNRLAVHVPNLVDSKIVSSGDRGYQGDGQYRCRLYQKGAQKIIGFEFGADVTMDMTETTTAAPHTSNDVQQRKILFKCVDSMFFTNFDGEWTATEVAGDNGEVMTQLTYKVLVRPKGPVPVAALEWRIREDVPTNLRAVKRAAITVGEKGVLSTRQSRASFQESVRQTVHFDRQMVTPVMVWGEDETMAKYLQNE